MNAAPYRVALALVLGLWSSTAGASPLTADEVVRYALAHHPDLVAAEGARETAGALQRDTAIFIENPELQLSGAVVGDLVQGQLVQPLSLTGEGRQAHRVAGATAQVAESEARRARFVVAAAARAAYVHAVAAGAAAALTEASAVEATRLREAVEARAAIGEAAPLDIRLARLGEVRASADAVVARREAGAARAALSAYHPDAASAELVEPVSLSASPGEGRSDLAAAAARSEAARAGLAQARAGALPPVGIGAAFQRDGGAWDAGPQVTLTLPLWARGRAEAAAGRAALGAAEAEEARARSIAAAEVAVHADAAAYADAAVARVGDPDADAREALRSVARAVEAGDLDVADAVTLRAGITDGWLAGVTLREASLLAHLDAQLAVESVSLLAGEAP